MTRQSELLSYEQSPFDNMLNREKCTLKELQSVIGKLQWACGVIIPGRVFLRRLINATCHLKFPYQSIKISDEMKDDIHLWFEFFQGYNGKSMFLPEARIFSNDINFFTDASKPSCGGFYGTSWFFIEFPNSWDHLHISVKELYPLYVALCVYGDKLKNNRIIFHSDNQIVVNIINKQTTKNKALLYLLRKFVLQTLKLNLKIHCFYIPGCQNQLADQISRGKVTVYNAEMRGLKKFPTRIPQEILPGSLMIP